MRLWILRAQDDDYEESKIGPKIFSLLSCTTDKSSNPHIWEAKTNKCLASLLKTWLKSRVI